MKIKVGDIEIETESLLRDTVPDDRVIAETKDKRAKNDSMLPILLNDPNERARLTWQMEEETAIFWVRILFLSFDIGNATALDDAIKFHQQRIDMIKGIKEYIIKSKH